MINFEMVHDLSKDFNVLYVEDDVQVRESTAEMFQVYFSSLDIAVDGQDALQKYKDYYIKNKRYYDVVISDIELPRMNGIELSDAILEIYHEQPIIIVSAHPDPMYLFELINLGISSFISKPINLNQINRVFYRKFQAVSRHKAELENREYEKIERNFLMGVMDLQDNLIVTTDGTYIESANQSFLNFFNCQTLKRFTSQYPSICDTFMHVDGYFHLGLLEENIPWVHHILNHPDEDFMVMMQNPITRQNESFKVTVNYFQEINKYIVTFTNITKIALKNKSNHQKAIYDNLTGIYNRNKLNDMLEELFHPIEKQHFAFILFDIDYFKKINDKYGHLIGDQALKQITETIKSNIRENDVFVRWGGDEFILIIQGVDSTEKAIKITKHLRQAIQESTFKHIGQLTSSFGVSLYQDGDTLNTIMDRADRGLYASKNKGRNSVTFI